MTRYIVLTAIALLLATANLSAQNFEDVIRYSQPQHMGTARSMAMGSAFGSLGGDFSALGINPAGIAVYRTSEFSFTPSLIFNSTESNFAGSLMKDNKTTFSLNQIGYVGTYRPMREVSKGVVSTHFGVGYNRNNNFNYKSMAFAPDQKFSLTDVINADAYGLDADTYKDNYRNPWDNKNPITKLSFGTFLIDKKDLEDGTGKQLYTSFLQPGYLVDQNRLVERHGYSGEFSLNTGINISNILMLGANLNFQSLYYEESSFYHERFSSGNPTNAKTFKQYSIEDKLRVSGKGISLKVGAIVKPIENLRIGAAYHSPTWYSIAEDYETILNVDFFNPVPEISNDKTGLDYIGEYDYQMNTPQKLIGSISYVFGKIAIISFDYEHMAYDGAKFKPNESKDVMDINDKNDGVKANLTSTSNYRIGAEIRINPLISVRAGYGLQDSPYKASPKDYENKSLSAGIGYRNKNYFIDMAYRNTAYNNRYIWYRGVNETLDPAPEFATVKSTDHYATLTLGWKF